ncbi:MAG: biotin/lipoyl-binding protein [Rhodobacterales bacterium]|nr:biotin/lipoyl-binding protein [Rhodobacterales bacterium]
MPRDDHPEPGRFRKAWLILPPLVVAVGLFAWAKANKAAPEQRPPEETVTRVRVIAAPKLTVVPRALGYGLVQPGKTWDAVAEVGGRVVAVHPDLKKGAILPAGAVLVRIDPTDYRIAIAQVEANLRSVDAQLQELTVREANTRASLDIESRTLALAGKDLDRKRQLLASKNVSQAAVDQEERNVLTRQQSLQTQRNLLNLIPAERAKLEAQKAVYAAQLEDARLNLERTAIAAPFAGRVSDVRIEDTQFAGAGQVLATLDGMDVSEVTAQVPIGRLMTIVGHGAAGALRPETVMDQLPDILSLTPVVRLNTGGRMVEWPARVARISDTVDPKTRTVGVIVAVDGPYRQARPGERPPLAKNMYVEVELRGAPRDGLVVIPRSALHGTSVYVVDAEGRLEIRDVAVGFLQADFAVIDGGLAADETVVLTDLVPAISGMRLEADADAGALADLADAAAGKGPVK